MMMMINSNAHEYEMDHELIEYVMENVFTESEVRAVQHRSLS